jgi:type III secretory pathway component EscR
MIYGNIYIVIGIFILIFILQIFSNKYRNYMKNNNIADKKSEHFKNFKKNNNKNDSNNLNNLNKKVKNNSRIINIKDFNLSFVEPNYAFSLFNDNIYIDTMNSVNYTARHSNNKYDCVKKYME